MKKLLLIVIASVCTVCIANAQEKGSIHLGAGIDVGLPLGDFGEGFGIGIGASAKGLYGLSDVSQATLTLGFLRFGMKDGSDMVTGSTGLIPVLAGYRHRFGSLYGEGQIGLTTVRTSIKFKDTGIGNFSGSSSSTHLGYGAGVGYLMDAWDIGVRFQGVSGDGGNLNFVALRVGYNFQLK